MYKRFIRDPLTVRIFVKIVLASAAAFIFFSCSEDSTEPSNSVPELTTAEVIDITGTTAKCGGVITSSGGASVTARGVCWSVEELPSLEDSTTNDGTGAGSFTSEITGLTAETDYYIRAYAVNSAGTGYGDTKEFSTTVFGTVTDIDGNIYETRKIGNQWWMTENLKVTHYLNGDSIAEVEDGAVWDGLAGGACCNYDNNASYIVTYGKLYNWFAVNDSRGLAPEGWHVASDAEWQELEIFMGMDPSEAADTGYRGTDEGGKLKEAGIENWASPNTGATNESGFTALPGGYRGLGGDYSSIHNSALLWVTTSITETFAWSRMLSSSDGYITRTGRDKNSGFSVRCVKD
ncbi:MAG: fibrobacter succinogenes major paralogous domain-containing protein [Candidatus Krumholzibacteriota bacterium]|nr:fibrobacter succinogenes major paralogous domain-containing protein [Candidatus Krumholzibacteriota bacterium]